MRKNLSKAITDTKKKTVGVFTYSGYAEYLSALAKATGRNVAELFVSACIQQYGCPDDLTEESVAEAIQRATSYSEPTHTPEAVTDDPEPQIQTQDDEVAGSPEPVELVEPASPSPAKPTEITQVKRVPTTSNKTERTDKLYRWMITNQIEVWGDCFDIFTPMAQIGFIHDSDSADELLTNNLFIITFRGYHNPKKYSSGVYENDPLLDSNRGGFITTIISLDPYGKEVLAGRSIPEKIVKQFNLQNLMVQAAGTYDVMFTVPEGLSGDEGLWGSCKESIKQIEDVYSQFADMEIIGQSSESIEEAIADGKVNSDEITFREFFTHTLFSHYAQWQYDYERFDLSKSESQWERKDYEG